MQGVGFRPFIHRLAVGNNLAGRVENRSDGVVIEVEGEETAITKFIGEISASAPPASTIKSLSASRSNIMGYNRFMIDSSIDAETEITEISPDIAVCPDCLEDLKNDPYRIGYPFINCTACGPRFTIVRRLPYDRENTSMNGFGMCSHCRSEYDEISDRRFHAQPVACNNCGPSYLLYDGAGYISEHRKITDAVAERLSDGRSVAIKGLGGYHLACDALNNNAVTDLRMKKHRDAKPFAVMFRDAGALAEYCHASPDELAWITSWRRPVVILSEKKKLAPSVNNGLGTIGAILPYMPFHYLLFGKLRIPAIVMTSGNRSGEPLIRDDDEAYRLLLPVTGAVVSHNRHIVNRTDDSVIRFINGKAGLIRRSRGFVPSPVDLELNVDGILALGPEQKNTFCIGKGDQAILSQHIGDLENLPEYEFFCETLGRYFEMFRFRPAAIACDMHPDYLTTNHAARLARELNISIIPVQHHHAHIASSMAENKLDEKVIGVCFDGTGYGTDGKMWGGEFMIADMCDFTRYAHFDYVELPGGDKVIEEPWRMACSYIMKYLGADFDLASLPFYNVAGSKKVELVRSMIRSKTNTPLSSGAGRLFDAVSALTGICPVAGFDSEAPVRLEAAAAAETDDYYPFEAGPIISFRQTFKGIVSDLGKENISVISARFHNTVARAVLEVCNMIRTGTSLGKVVLSGGVFQNSLLAGRVVRLLNAGGFTTYMNHIVPPNDGGISLGQLVVASKKIKKCA